MRRSRLVAGTAAFLFAFPVMAWLSRSAWLPHAIADAPNAGKSADGIVRSAVASTGRQLRVPVGPPNAELAVSLVEPSAKPRGTIIVLHGIRDRVSSMVGLGRTFADGGYRAVLVDLRGHGESTGDVLSFGAREGKDLVQVVDRLAADGLLVEPLGAYGPSYGGAAALQLARRDPRVRAVVTVATFTTMREIVSIYTHRIAPSWFVSEGDVQRAIDRAGELGQFDPNESSSLAAIQETRAPVLLIHGRADAHIPFEHAERLHAAAKDHSGLLLLHGKNHGTIMSDPLVARESLAWFDRSLFQR